jgi:hypothetical protein
VTLDTLSDKGVLLNPGTGGGVASGWLEGCLTHNTYESQGLGFDVRTIRSAEEAIKYAHKLARTLGGLVVPAANGELIDDWEPLCTPRNPKAKDNQSK